ncbi:MAG: deoxyribonuclease V [Dehalococcoidia bacterium]|nr:MAG: deoxyribonuclease V [Dehalococcoidia bacterium]
MKITKLHRWQGNIYQAKEIQKRLALKVLRDGEVVSPKYIAGVDIAITRTSRIANAAVVVVSYPGLQPVEVETMQGELEMPYIPGLLSFRESPLIMAACSKLKIVPDLMIVDGQGIAHPRKLGIASHIGLMLNLVTIGCAKSRLYGHCMTLSEEAGSYAEIVDNDEIIGATLRTKRGVKPLYISIGHKINLKNAIYWVMQCCREYRLPEPIRLAHVAAGKKLEYKN